MSRVQSREAGGRDDPQQVARHAGQSGGKGVVEEISRTSPGTPASPEGKVVEELAAVVRHAGPSGGVVRTPAVGATRWPRLVEEGNP